MHIVFLRGSVPPKNEHPEKLLYKNIARCEDMWTQLFYYLTKKMGATAEFLYLSPESRRTFCVDESFIERWVPSLSTFKPMRKPNLIVCRGGFPYYDDFVKRFPKAKKVYYGAGTRYFPQTNFTKYDLFLVDSLKQQKSILEKGKNAHLFIKPASTLFVPKPVDKKYDICFMANASTGRIKRHKDFIKVMAGSKYSILSLGNTDSKYIKLAKKLGTNITWGGWSLRKDLPSKISQCKVGICCSTNYDSCPRVIPEYLACGLPVIATKNMNFWHERYIMPQSGRLVSFKEIPKAIGEVINYPYHSVRFFYENSIGMDTAVYHLNNLIERIL